MFIVFIACVFISAIFIAVRLLSRSADDDSKLTRKVTGIGACVFAVLSVLSLLLSMFTIVPASTVGVIVTFGKVSDEVLPEGGHFVLPWQSVREVKLATATAVAEKSAAGSKDLQSVHSSLTANYHIIPDKARSLFVLNPSLTYENQFVVPAMYEVFKAVVAQYTAEELLTRRNEVSKNVVDSLNAKLSQYHLRVESVNMVDFGFSKAFDAAIEEKVTASQKAETAKRNLDRVRFEAEAREAQAEGEAKAIAIQAAAVEKQGGAAYIQLRALERWDGKLPQYIGGNGVVPFVNVGGK